MRQHKAQSATTDSQGFQFSLASLGIAIVWVAIMCVAIRSPIPQLAALIGCTALLSLSSAVVMIILRRRRAQAFAIGFLAAGVAYQLWLQSVELPYPPQGIVIRETSSSRVAAWIYEQLHVRETRTLTMPAGGYGGSSGGYGGGGFFAVEPDLTEPTDEPPEEESPNPSSSNGFSGTPAKTISYQVPRYALQDLKEIVHWSLTMLLALIGGILAQMIYAARQKELSRAPQ